MSAFGSSPRPDYLARFPARPQYSRRAMLASARRMTAAGLERYLSTAERRLLTDADAAAAEAEAERELMPEQTPPRGPRHRHLGDTAALPDDGLPAQYEPLMYH